MELYCRRCGNVVRASDNQEYPYQCDECEEDLYEFETESEEQRIMRINAVMMDASKIRYTRYNLDIGYYVLEPLCQARRVKHYSEGVLDIYQGDAIDRLAEYEDLLEQQEQNNING